YDLLARRYGTVVVSGTQTIEPTVTNDEEAEVLGVPVQAPAFLFERTSTSDRGEVVEFVRSIYRGDRYRLLTGLRPALGSRERRGALWRGGPQSDALPPQAVSTRRKSEDSKGVARGALRRGHDAGRLRRRRQQE